MLSPGDLGQVVEDLEVVAEVVTLALEALEALEEVTLAAAPEEVTLAPVEELPVPAPEAEFLAPAAAIMVAEVLAPATLMVAEVPAPAAIMVAEVLAPVADIVKLQTTATVQATKDMDPASTREERDKATNPKVMAQDGELTSKARENTPDIPKRLSDLAWRLDLWEGRL